jgi:hypothetical protein
MQHKIGDSYARAFTYAFYPPLLSGGTIDEAVEAGRASIRSETRQKEYPIPDPDWGSPVLYLRTHSGQIIQPVSEIDIRTQAARLSDGQTALFHIWWGWETLRETASEVQLKTLEDGADDLDIPPIELILLLRSTLEIDQPAATWIERLRNTGGDYIQRLDDHKEPTASGSETVALLGLDEKTQEGRPHNTGPIAWAAVKHADHITRRTAALSLTAVQPAPENGLERLHSVLNQVGGRWSFHRWSLQSELHGALADADPKLESMTGKLALIDRFGVWMWRFRQRVHQDRERIAFLVLGAALGAGLALGLWRALIAAIAPAQSIAIRFSISFFWGALLGMCVGLAIGLSRPLMVGYPKWNEKSSQLRHEYVNIERKQAWLAVILGTIFFGVAHVFVALSNGLPLNERWLVLISGAIAGFGINLALYGQPHSGKRSGVGGWVIRLMAAVLFAILAQWLVFRIQPLLPNFTQGDELWAATSITRRGSSYADYFGIFQDLSVWLRANQDKVSYFDAAVVNVLMTIGIALGIYKGVDWLAHWISDGSD